MADMVRKKIVSHRFKVRIPAETPIDSKFPEGGRLESLPAIKFDQSEKCRVISRSFDNEDKISFDNYSSLSAKKSTRPTSLGFELDEYFQFVKKKKILTSDSSKKKLHGGKKFHFSAFNPNSEILTREKYLLRVLKSQRVAS